MAVKRDYYDVLGVARGASDDDIKRSFRALARTLHPDVSAEPNAEARFREVAEAYEVLSDVDARARYDRFGHEATSGQHFQSEQFVNLSDLFSSLLGRDVFTASGPAGGADAEAQAEISLNEAAFGAKLELDIDLVQACEHCGASGAEPPSLPSRCPDCGGSGQVRQVVNSAFGQMVRSAQCRRCSGRGRTVDRPCVECRGRGRRAQKRHLTVAVPAGIEDGQSIRVARAGHEGEPGGRSGDLYVHVRVTPDARFERDGLDLISAVDLTVSEAMLGCTKTVPTLEGEASLEFKPGTQPGEVRLLRGKGMPSLRGGGRGSQRVLVNVQVPRNLTKQQRALVEQFRDSEADQNYRESGGLRDAIRRAFG